jgi:DNA polymerase III alpha subunit
MQMTKATEQQGIELLYRNRDISNIPFDAVEQFNKFCDDLDVEKLVTDIEYNKAFNIPQYYKDIDVEQFVRNLIPEGKGSDVATARVEMELAEYKARNMYPVLQLMIYIVNTLRKNDLVWGVGRGSSVASYVLYLIGIHKIDSLKYNLNIEEFLK